MLNRSYKQDMWPNNNIFLQRPTHTTLKSFGQNQSYGVQEPQIDTKPKNQNNMELRSQMLFYVY